MKFASKFSSRRRALALGGVGALMAAGVVTLPVTMAQAATACNVTYTANQWQGGFTASVRITNSGDPVTSWTLGFSFPSGQQLQQGWSAQWSQSGSQVTARNLDWNGRLASGASTEIGFNGSWTSANNAPTTFTLNGVTCNGGGGPTTPPTSQPPTQQPPTSQPPTSQPPAGPRVDNPYVGARGYVNPEWRAKAESVAGGNRISNTPTGVWLDRIAAIDGTDNSQSNGPMGLRDHLDEALRQNAGYIQIVIYNLPARDCAALASNGELGINDLPRYRTEYIDRIAAIQADARYRNLRIINIIEIDSLPNLVTNTTGAGGTELCRQVQQRGVYVDGIAYAVDRLGAIPNVYNYIDAAHHGWIGWDDNFVPSAQLFAQVGRLGGMSKVHGFITNTANYSALREPYIQVNDQTRQSSWIDWNRYNDELTFAQAFRQELVRQGFDSNIGMLIDTSRNGWGGAARPTGPSTAGDINTQVNQSRIDRRIHKGNWCNQSGAGLGERPTAAPAAGIDAYVWIKPPGESDGSSRLIPNDDGKGFDEMCDPAYGGNARNGNMPSGALPNAPISGAWFPAQFRELMQNAYPPLN